LTCKGYTKSGSNKPSEFIPLSFSYQLNVSILTALIGFVRLSNVLYAKKYQNPLLNDFFFYFTEHFALDLTSFRIDSKAETHYN